MPKKSRKLRVLKRVRGERKESDIVVMFLHMLNTVKLYHWKTRSYAQHKATDELYGNLNTNIDRFVETMLGKNGGRIHLPKHEMLPLTDFSNTGDFRNQVEQYKRFLMHLQLSPEEVNADLRNIRDELLGNLNQFTYLLTFQ